MKISSARVGLPSRTLLQEYFSISTPTHISLVDSSLLHHHRWLIQNEDRYRGRRARYDTDRMSSLFVRRKCKKTSHANEQTTRTVLSNLVKSSRSNCESYGRRKKGNVNVPRQYNSKENLACQTKTHSVHAMPNDECSVQRK